MAFFNTRYNKFYVAVVGALVSVGLKMLSNRLGVDLTIYEVDIVYGISNLLTAALVWRVPNAEPEA